MLLGPVRRESISLGLDVEQSLSLCISFFLCPSFSICTLSVLCLTPSSIPGDNSKHIFPVGVREVSAKPSETLNDQDNVREEG